MGVRREEQGRRLDGRRPQLAPPPKKPSGKGRVRRGRGWEGWEVGEGGVRSLTVSSPCAMFGSSGAVGVAGPHVCSVSVPGGHSSTLVPFTEFCTGRVKGCGLRT